MLLRLSVSTVTAAVRPCGGDRSAVVGTAADFLCVSRRYVRYRYKDDNSLDTPTEWTDQRYRVVRVHSRSVGHAVVVT